MKPIASLGLALLLLVSATSTYGRVIATVDGTPIFQGQVDRALRQQINPTRMALLSPEQRQAAMDQAERAVLNELVGRILLVNAARREGIEVPQDELNKRMQLMTNRIAPGKSSDEFLAQAGLDREEFLRDVEQTLLIEKLIEVKTENLPPPTEEEIAQYYQKNPGEFQQAENVKVRHISLSTLGMGNPIQIDAKRQRAEAIRKELLENAELDFAEVAKKQSEAPSAADGGSLGPFGRGQRVVEPEFEEAAFTQEVGAIGKIIQSKSGFHIIRVEEKNPPRMLRYDEVQAPIATYLTQMKRRETMKDLIDQWRAVAKIERVQGQ